MTKDNMAEKDKEAAESADFEEEGNFETIETLEIEDNNQVQNQFENNALISEDQQSIFSYGLVIIEADKNTPFWSQIKDQVNEVVEKYMETTNSRFIVYQKSTSFLTENLPMKKHKVYFEDVKAKGKSQQIQYDGTPYFYVGKKVLDCEFGVDRCVASKKKLLDIKALEALNKFSGNEHPATGGKVIKRRKHAISKKFSCPCRIYIKDTIFFPSHKAEAKTDYHKRKASRILFQDLQNGKEIPMKRKVFMKFLFANEHQNHPKGGPKGRRRRRDRRKTKNLDEDNGSTLRSTVNDHDYIDPSLPNDMIGGIPTTTYRIWSKYMLQLVNKLNNFHQPGSSKELCRPFMVKGIQCGIIPFPVISELQEHQDVFPFVKDDKTENIKYITIAEHLKTAEEKSLAVDRVLHQLKEKNVFSSLNGWRNELYSVSSSFGYEILLEMERSATCLFGIHTYGVHVNGFVKNDQDQMMMWIGRRSNNKQTWPGKLDNMVGGGLTSRSKIESILIKECLEEAMLPEELAKKAKPAGTVSYTFEDERGIFPETQFIFDLEVPTSFQPMNLDGEMQAFYLVTIEEVKALIATDEFKPNCALIVLDFLIRHGFIHPDEEPHYTDFLRGMHK